MALADERKLYSVGLDSDESQTVSKPSGATDGFAFFHAALTMGRICSTDERMLQVPEMIANTASASSIDFASLRGSPKLVNRPAGKKMCGRPYGLPHKPIGSGYTAVRILPKGKSLIAAEG